MSRSNLTPAAEACGAFVVIDFETTGMSPQQGARITEVGAVRIVNGRLTEHFQSLVRTGAWVPPFIEQLTGISNAMLRGAPPAAEVLPALARFIGSTPLVAHNASFDRRFLDAELAREGLQRTQPMLCSMRVSRRVFPQAPAHKLATLVHWAGLPSDGVCHRALADAQMTAHLWLHIAVTLRARYGFGELPLRLFANLQNCPAAQADGWLRRMAAGLH
ncbi:3'-5' exonuclease [Plasticicumulans acidivorans]|uniref:DNA-directed DNA polymerase n=1 Tax=Plasticicumulans acidivorans TaxID=886464 RepID=A0A317N0E9_9GAMM|nr:3'-5' exonuclease [Plasticicumulans acidivorans]PWV65965.1 DNA polymerase-3 subunit epsilon [Plasticicumulans acidivorans]